MKTSLFTLAVFACFIFASPFVYADKKGDRKGGNKGGRGDRVNRERRQSRPDNVGRDDRRQRDNRPMRDDRVNRERRANHDRREGRRETRDWREYRNRHHHPRHWGGSSWGLYVGVGGLNYYYGPRYYSSYTYYYPIAPWYRPHYVVWEHYWYLSSREGICPGHGFAHDDGYCEYWYDDRGGVEVRWWP